ncbi:hypothetical protein GCM10017687_44120 [Streptomyces echinatus]
MCERLGTDRTNDVLDHMKARIREHGTDEDRADLERAEKEVAERRARKGGRPKQEPPGRQLGVGAATSHTRLTNRCAHTRPTAR